MKKTTVLVVDDDMQMLDELEVVLNEKNMKTFKASNAQESLRLAEEHPFDAAVVDIRLPDGNGVHLIDTLRKRRPEAAYILITAYASLETAIRAIQNGIQDYLLKPFNPDELLAALERSLHLKELSIQDREKLVLLSYEKKNLEEKLEYLRKLNEIFVGREERILELKREVNGLLQQLHRNNKYEGC